MSAQDERISKDETSARASDISELGARGSVSDVAPRAPSHFARRHDSMPPSGPPPSSGAELVLGAELLGRIHECFATLAGPDSGIDAGELQRSLEVQSPFLAERVLLVLDRNRDGFVSRCEFVRGVPRLLFGSLLDKLRFVFRLHDLNGDGAIDRGEIVQMLELALSENGVPAAPGSVRRFSEVLLAAADENGDGRLSFREFEALATRHSQTTALISRSEADWLAPGQELLQERREVPSISQRVVRFVDNRPALVVLVALWAFANVLIFANAVFEYRARGASPFIQLARGAGACINLGGGLMALTMARSSITWARRVPGLRLLPLDDSVALHRWLGGALLVMSLVHAAAHGANWAMTPASLRLSLWQSSAGLTGIALLGVFAAMWVFSRPAVRADGHFELFYWTHLLYLLWFALALAHGPVFWLWAGVPLAIFGVERLLRITRSRRGARVLELVPLASGVTRLTIEKPAGFEHQPGDYLFLNVPKLARHEWHPFTISSAPERDALTLHVRSLGNFTGALHALAEERARTTQPPNLEVCVDGPFGTVSQRVLRSRHAVLIAAGIGVTPFASVLDSLVLRGRAGRAGLEQAYFYWLNRDAVSFEWFAELLARLERAAPERLVEIRIFMTGGRATSSAALLNLAREIARELGDPDVYTGLRAMTHMGPPDWRAELAPIAAAHGGSVDVFFCGPPGLGRKVHAVCSELGLDFYEERF